MTIESDSVRLVEAAGLSAAPPLVALARAHLTRTRRARRYGVGLGLVLGVGPLAGDQYLNLGIERVLTGFLLGLLFSELVMPAPVRKSVRTAALHQRTSRDLLQRPVRALPWLALTPALALPLLALGTHPRGASSTSGVAGTCSATAYWPSTASLCTGTFLAVLALVTTEITVRRLIGRAQPGDSQSVLMLQHTLRCRSARSAIAAATALGLVMAAAVAEAVFSAAHSYVCLPQVEGVSPLPSVYSWAPAGTPWLQKLSVGLLLAALAAWLTCTRLPTPRAADTPTKT
jgi:hypothetical protein